MELFPWELSTLMIGMLCFDLTLFQEQSFEDYFLDKKHFTNITM